MAREKSPAFSYYPKDLLSDGRAVAMDADTFGCYWWLVSICWLEQSLPDDLVECYRLVRGKIPEKRFDAVWPEIRACFVLGVDGRLRHGRLEKERGQQDAYRERSRRGGQASVKARQGAYGSADPRAQREPDVNQQVHVGCELNVNKPVHDAHEVNVNTPSPSSSADIPPVAPHGGAEPKTGSAPKAIAMRPAQLRRRAEHIRASVWLGWCKHDPPCAGHEPCVARIVTELRAAQDDVALAAEATEAEEAFA
jgi:hypothetical protein